jgi:hypothetical protein
MWLSIKTSELTFGYPSSSISWVILETDDAALTHAGRLCNHGSRAVPWHGGNRVALELRFGGDSSTDVRLPGIPWQLARHCS